MRMRPLVGAVVAAVGIAVATATPAVATDSSTATDASPRIVAVRTTPMTMHHEVSAVPRGSNIVVTLDNGASFAVPAREYKHAQQQARNRIQPLNTVFGNCGYSYTYLYDWGSLKYR